MLTFSSPDYSADAQSHFSPVHLAVGTLDADSSPSVCVAYRVTLSLSKPLLLLIENELSCSPILSC